LPFLLELAITELLVFSFLFFLLHMARKKKSAKHASSLVLHRTPDSSVLLEAATTGKPEPLRLYLAAGGHPDTLVTKAFTGGVSVQVPLTFAAVGSGLKCADSVALLTWTAALHEWCAGDFEFFTPLMHCINRGTTAEFETLLRCGADPLQQVPDTGNLERCKL
jgi:hypothetical protein